MGRPSHLSETDLGRLTDHVSRRLVEVPVGRLAGAEAEVRACLDELAYLSCRAEGRDPTPLVLPAARAWGHVVAVLGGDLGRALAGSPDPALESRGIEVLRRLRRVLP